MIILSKLVIIMFLTKTSYKYVYEKFKGNTIFQNIYYYYVSPMLRMDILITFNKF